MKEEADAAEYEAEAVEAAKKLIYESIKDNPYIYAPEFLLGQIYFSQNKLDKACGAYHQPNIPSLKIAVDNCITEVESGGHASSEYVIDDDTEMPSTRRSMSEIR